MVSKEKVAQHGLRMGAGPPGGPRQTGALGVIRPYQQQWVSTIDGWKREVEVAIVPLQFCDWIGMFC